MIFRLRPSYRYYIQLDSKPTPHAAWVWIWIYLLTYRRSSPQHSYPPSIIPSHTHRSPYQSRHVAEARRIRLARSREDGGTSRVRLGGSSTSWTSSSTSPTIFSGEVIPPCRGQRGLAGTPFLHAHDIHTKNLQLPYIREHHIIHACRVDVQTAVSCCL